MERYWIKADKNSDILIISELTDEQPENSILYQQEYFNLPIFDKYPNPTQVIEKTI